MTRPGMGARIDLCPCRTLRTPCTGCTHRTRCTRSTLVALSLPPRDERLVHLATDLDADRAIVATGMKPNLARRAAVDHRHGIGIDPRRVDLTALALIVTVNARACSAGSTATVQRRPFTTMLTFIAEIPAARAAPREIGDRPSSIVDRGPTMDDFRRMTPRSTMPDRRWPITHIAAAMAAISDSSLRVLFLPFCSSSRSTYVVSKSAAANSGDATRSRQNPIVVLMPRTSYSANARTIRAMAPGRSGAHATTFEISGSYAVGTVHPSKAPLSSRIPGPDGVRRCVIRPGDGRNPSSGFSA